MGVVFVGKTQVPLATIDLSCPHCNKNNPISFTQEVDTLPLVKLAVGEKVVGKCSSCGFTFDYKNKDMIYRYMDKNKLPYKRADVGRNRLFIIAPAMIVIVLAIVSAVFIFHVQPPEQVNMIIVNGSNASAVPASSATAIKPTVTPVPPSPVVVNGTDRYDIGRGKYYLPVSLKAGNNPADLQQMTVTVRMNNQTITPNAWEYSGDSCLWKVHNLSGSLLGRNDSATIIVDVSHYNFENGSVIYLDFRLPGYQPLTTNFIMSRNGSVILLPPVIYTGEYDYVSGKMVDLNDTNIVKVSGRVIVNKWPATNIAVSFYDNYTTNTVTSVEDGYYTIVLKKNQTYRLKVWSTAYGTIMQDSTPRIFVNDTILDIKLTT